MVGVLDSILIQYICVCVFHFCFWHFVRLGRADTESHFPVAILPRSIFFFISYKKKNDTRCRSIECSVVGVCVAGTQKVSEAPCCNLHIIHLIICVCSSNWPFGVHSILIQFPIFKLSFIYRHRWHDGFFLFLVTVICYYCLDVSILFCYFNENLQKMGFYFLSSIFFFFSFFL